ncbi:hypothetical protein [Nostoc sp. FACHB-110]|uniref:hypothetical protein n=1 Tax=Nostoc sp. FACHB-110 TaxID=2692834 RepID=UPI001F557A7F|nr:hypothetical protein [Nostoc sp. FACHB-110]
MQTARGNALFDIYEGIVIIDGIEFTIPVHIGDEIPDTVLRVLWLDIMQLIVNKPNGILTLEIVK